MKKTCILILLLLIISSPLNINAQEKRVSVEIPKFDVTINGVKVDNVHSKYPFIVYNYVTYVPMTWDCSKALGLQTSWSETEGIKILKTNETDEIKMDTTGNNLLDAKYLAIIPEFNIEVNGKKIDNSKEEYPILNFRYVTYFPLTWRFVVDEFGLKSDWDEQKGLSISNDVSAIEFNDKGLEKGVRENINKATGDIFESDVRNIKELTLSDYDIKDLSGLSKFANLEKLYLDNNYIENIDEIKSLTSLKVLYLQRNKIEDIKPLKNLINLEELSLNGNKIEKIGSLSGLTNLKKLYLAENDISDVDSLKSLVNLNELYLQRNSIQNIYSLSNLINLQELSLNGNEVSDIKPLANLTNLKGLYIVENKIEDIECLKGLKNIKSLYMKYGNDIKDYDPVKTYYENIESKDFDLE
ncbi:leucine-rich repeat domain-containing protein [Tepidibacter hydrothermalis]|uniref:Leucine-rich repeat domain-containing protein n=1 Tax=Tepidibacter hydrothermalis TaxID=3036126 RepID=A0ABY8EEX9_9FIRM|nr:leucine-rich repeat domain-containing protein [Tepidibacter hydrothermalis]WFD09283.1 leucine-rich repeat domain-containing protein [Tepidibacter hydrothermalis]